MAKTKKPRKTAKPKTIDEDIPPPPASPQRKRHTAPALTTEVYDADGEWLANWVGNPPHVGEMIYVLHEGNKSEPERVWGVVYERRWVHETDHISAPVAFSEVACEVNIHVKGRKSAEDDEE